jgi:LysM repeat protein
MAADAAAAAPAAATGDTSAPKAANASGSMTHVVKPGETLGTIARKYQVKMSEIAVANNITNPALVRSGMTLIIPGWQAPKSAKAPEAAPAPAPVSNGGDQNPLIKISPADAKPAAGPKPAATPTDVPVIKVDDSPPANPTKSP